MNRLTPLISRRPGPQAAMLPVEAPIPFAGTDAARWLEDVKLFATGWVGGLIFIGTLFS